MLGDADEIHEQRLLTLVGCIHGLVLELDGDARYLNVWADDPALLARPREQAIGFTVNEVLGPHAGPPLTALVLRVFTSGQTEHLEYPLEIDGRTRWFFADIKRVRAGTTWTVVVFARDISERRAAEEALRQSEERYRLAALATNDVLYDVHVPSGHVTWGPSAKSIFLETTIEESVRWWASRIHPEDAERVQASIRRALDGDAASWSSRYRMRRADGTYADLLDRGFIVRNDAAAVRMVGSMADVTHLNRLEAQLVQADKLAAIGVLAAGVGHEINNPLSYVLGNIEYALDCGPFADSDVAKLREDESRSALLEAREGALRIAEIVRSLRLFSQNEPVAVSLVQVEAVLERSIKMAENEIRHRARLVRRFSPVPAVRVNESQLGQVCLNLLINAAQAIPDGSQEKHEIRLATGLDPRGRVFISVSDTGPGIKPENIDRIFEPFFTTKPIGSGTGIGLSVCLGIVQSMGGELTVSSEPHLPTIFVVTLPAALADEDQASRRRPLAAAPAKVKRRMLLVDDDVGVTRYIERVMRAECDVTIATSSCQAIDALASGTHFDVVLCDVMMPEMNGVELYEVLRVRYPEVLPRVYFMTGGAFTAEAARFVEQLADRALEKPVSKEQLRKLLTL